MFSNKTISVKNNPFLFEQIAYTLNLIADATGDVFAIQASCLANVRAIMAKLRPELLTTNAFFKPAINQNADEIRPAGYVDEMFGEFSRDLNNFSRIVYVAPLQRIQDENTATVSVRLENGEERIVVFREYHSGMTDSLMGPSIEKQ